MARAYHWPVPALVLYREGLTKGERWARCGFGLPLRSLRASWETVIVDVDSGPQFSVRTAMRQVVMLPTGRHQVSVRARGFAPSTTTVDLVDERGAIVAITPEYLGLVSRATPLGQLRAHVVNGPEELHPYRFYRSWPPHKGTVVPALFLSAVGSTAAIAFGAAALAAAVYVITRHALVGLLLLACIAVVAPTLLLGGAGGLVTAVRFLRLSPDWRAPTKPAGAPRHQLGLADG